jgi:hypothetical protein
VAEVGGGIRNVEVVGVVWAEPTVLLLCLAFTNDEDEGGGCCSLTPVDPVLDLDDDPAALDPLAELTTERD